MSFSRGLCSTRRQTSFLLLSILPINIGSLWSSFRCRVGCSIYARLWRMPGTSPVENTQRRPNAVTLLSLEDPGVAELLAFCVDAFFPLRLSLTILGDHAGIGRDDFSGFLAAGFRCVGVNALKRNRIPIRVAGNGVVLAVVVGSELILESLPFRIRAFGSDLEALSDSFVCQRSALRRRARAELRFRKIEFPRSNDGVSLRKAGQRG